MRKRLSAVAMYSGSQYTDDTAWDDFIKTDIFRSIVQLNPKAEFAVYTEYDKEHKIRYIYHISVS
jgi:hypothetical protein